MNITPLAAIAQRVVCDESCKIEFQQPADDATPGKTEAKQARQDVANYSVVSPVGRSTVKMITQAKRLENLDGKTIAIVGESFMTYITHPELKRLILQHYPTAKVLTQEEIGSAGVYPGPGVTRRQKDEFQQKLKAYGVDAVICGNCGCGLCTPKETGSLIVAEQMGIPAVAVAGPSFVREVYYTSINNGVPAPRVAEYSGAFTADTKERLLKNTREVVYPQIIEALTRPITDSEVAENAGRDKGDIRDNVFYGTLDEVNAHFREMGWSDGLPVIPPTYERVTEFLRYTDLPWQSTVATLSPAYRNTTVWHVAVNAVMAGCKPEYMPILIAMTRAMGVGDFRRTIASTHGWVPYSWVNGPIARQLGISCADGEISAEANVALGRFMNLVLINLSGYYVGMNRMGTFGYLMPWCMAEDEEACRSIGWQPYHVRQGYRPDDNTITVGSALQWGNNMAPSTTDAGNIEQLMAWDITQRCQFALGSGKQFTYRTILITAPVAANLAKGFATPDALEDALIKDARRPLKERSMANYYANPGSNPEEKRLFQQWNGHIAKTEGAAMTPTPQWYDTDSDELRTVPTMKKGMTAFLITGDASRNKIQTMPGGGYATVKIELPGNWDTLMKELGYPALK